MITLEKTVFCIAGPTASGKSAVAVKLAKTVGGEIINADSMQVYRDLHIISARPESSEMDGVPHHLFGHIDGAQRYNVGAWLSEAVLIAKQISARGLHPIFVGGTGLYFKALTEGLAVIPDAGNEAREQAEAILRDEGISALRDQAEHLDYIAAGKVLGDDPQRLQRIVSVSLGTGKALSTWQAQTVPAIAAESWTGAVLMPDRAALYARINGRFEAMAENGGLTEVSKLQERGLSTLLPVMKAIGVPELIRAENAADEMAVLSEIEMAKQQTRRFAKRQMTWFRNQTPLWPKFDSGTALLEYWQDFA
ncbi:tRNA (adenosine(37)-N6)-dimethylallyltransferase MiaA [Robiginitomaculum antarcticum]|uniref:tRNA (adenosine(37)-N6)-dimethylallyltransferase MiaA n=1 Tax=Robiginitomaculum antarcticum TaxID=437507 RepID=UPI00037206DB|nr:tRNA (adenosine(37)-N6)-dimethylallyltransferase MiaA [Robiginitomaculum antarcticum]